jgi:hypothetical protein
MSTASGPRRMRSEQYTRLGQFYGSFHSLVTDMISSDFPKLYVVNQKRNKVMGLQVHGKYIEEWRLLRCYAVWLF